MISVTDLLEAGHLPSNYFAPDVYVQGDFEAGLIESRNGARLLALPEVLLQGIYAGLEEELGPSAGIVLFKWGFRWGKQFYRRFAEEISEYYNKPLAEMEMVEFLQSLKQCWKTYGWGVIDLDVNYYQQGFLVIRGSNSPFAQAVSSSKHPVCFAEAGILSAFFSQLTGRNLHCIQTACESMQAECNYFVVGLPERLKPVEAWIEKGQDHATIMEHLSRNQASMS